MTPLLKIELSSITVRVNVSFFDEVATRFDQVAHQNAEDEFFRRMRW